VAQMPRLVGALGGLALTTGLVTPPPVAQTPTQYREDVDVEASAFVPELSETESTPRSFEELLRRSLVLAGGTEENDEKERAIEEENKKVCHAITECYCMRHTLKHMNNVCGWCESKGRAYVGSERAPDEMDGYCAYWIFNSKNCPNLWCSEDYGLWWWSACTSPLVVALVLVWMAKIAYATKPPLPFKPPSIQLQRTKDQFFLGLWGRRALIPPGKTFQTYFSGGINLHNPFHGIRLRTRSCFDRVLSHVAWFSLYSALFNTCLKVAPIFLHKIHYDMICEILVEASRLSSVLNMIMSFLFSFYALGRVSWWWDVMNQARLCQGRNHDLAMIMSGYTCAQKPTTGESWLEHRWTFYRFQMLAFIFAFRKHSATFGQIDYSDMENCSLMEPSERAILEKCLHPRDVVMKWWSMFIEHHVLDGPVRALMLDKLCQLRQGYQSIDNLVQLRAPWSFEAILSGVVTLWVVIIPLSTVQDVRDRTMVRDSLPLMVTITNVLACGFYLTVLALLDTFKDPFGLWYDSMDCETILLETDTSIWDYLTAPVPECLRDQCQDKQLHLPSNELALGESEVLEARVAAPSSQSFSVEMQAKS